MFIKLKKFKFNVICQDYQQNFPRLFCNIKTLSSMFSLIPLWNGNSIGYADAIENETTRVSFNFYLFFPV